MKALIALALALFGCSELAQLKWVASTNVDEFGNTASLSALLRKDAATRIKFVCFRGQKLAVAVHKPGHWFKRAVFSEPIEVRFADEAPITIFAYRVNFQSFALLDDEDAIKGLGYADPAELARKLTRHGKFGLSYHIKAKTMSELTASTFEYDQDSAKDAIGKVLGHCGHEL